MTRNIVAIAAFVICVLASASVRADAKVAVGMSKEDMLVKGWAVVTSAEDKSRTAAESLANARKAADMIMTSCVGNALTQINAVKKTAKVRFALLKKAGTRAGQEHEFTVLMVLDGKLVTLDQTAAQCIGKKMFETGTTSVETTIDAASKDTEDVKMSDAVGSYAPTTNIVPKVISSMF